MPTAYSHVLYAVSGLSSDSSLVPAPPGKTMVVRDVDLYCGLTGIQTVGEIHLVDGITGGSIALFSFDITDTDKKSFTWRGRQVFESAASDSFGFTVQASQWDIRVSGYLLDS